MLALSLPLGRLHALVGPTSARGAPSTGQTASVSRVIASLPCRLELILPEELRAWNRQHLVPMSLLPVSVEQCPKV